MARATRGFSLVDVIVGIALLLVLFLALFGVLRASLALSAASKSYATATSLAETQMEYLRSLSYDNLGTMGGIPPGVVAQSTTTTSGGGSFVTNTFISYVDDPADGLGAADTNGITTDYKTARVSVSYQSGAASRSVVLVSYFAPPGIETSAGGGTLAIDVVNKGGAPVPGATVQIINAATSPTVNLTTFTNSSGQVYLPGAATSSAYQVTVSKSGYSSAQTYASDSANQSPNPGYLTVVKDTTTTQTFAIDLLAALNIATYSPIATSTFSDSFADASKLSSEASTTAAGGKLTLLPGETSGLALSAAITPAHLASWGDLNATMTVPAGSSAVVQVYDGSGSLLPDSALPGNSSGFSSFPISLSGVSTTTYPSLMLGASLATTGDAPSLSGWSLAYAVGPIPLPDVPFTLTGAKTIGSQGDGTPVYKTVMNTSTGSDGTQGLSLEWDSYSLTVPGYDVEDACLPPPYLLAPGSTTNAALYLVGKTTNSLRVLVTDNAGAFVPGTSVTLSDAGYSHTAYSSSCGVAYFGNVPAATDYSVTIAKSGYSSTAFPNVAVSGAATLGASFP